MTRYYDVVAVCVDADANILRPSGHGFDAEGRRATVVDTVSNLVFSGCDGPWDVEDQYEAYWNRLNDSWEDRFPLGKERVKVLRVTRLTDDEGRLRLLGEAAAAINPSTPGNAKSHVAPTRAQRKTR